MVNVQRVAPAACCFKKKLKNQSHIMEVVLALPLLIIPFIMPLIAGLMAKTYGRSFWTWFLIGIPLPFIANIILLCLRDKTAKSVSGLKAIRNEEKPDSIDNNEVEETEVAATA
jgi:hypothetical protein